MIYGMIMLYLNFYTARWAVHGKYFGGITMTGLEITLGIILLAMALFLVVAVTLQDGKDKNSGVITGGSETFFGKSKATTADKILNRLTIAISIIFTLVVIVMYIVV